MRRENGDCCKGTSRRAVFCLLFGIGSGVLVVGLWLLSLDGMWAGGRWFVRAVLYIVGFPSLLALLAVHALFEGLGAPDAMSDGAAVGFAVLLVIPTMCFWGGVGWLVGHLIEKRKLKRRGKADITC